MTVVLVVLAVLLLVALGRWGFRSMLSERRSVRNYLHAMEVLGEISRSQASGRATANGAHGRAQRAAEPKPAPRPRQAAARAPAAEKTARRSSRAAVPEGWAPPEPAVPVVPPPPGRPRAPLVFVSEELTDHSPRGAPPASADGSATAPEPPVAAEDAPAVEPGFLPAAEDPVAPPAARPEAPPWRHQARARRRRRRAALAPVAALVVAAAGTAGTLAAVHHPPARPLGQPAHQARPAPPRPLPPPPVAPTTSDFTQAVYQVARPSFSVLLSASGPCWVELRQGESGPMIWEGTLTQGQTRLQPSEGPLWVRLGNPANISVSLNGLPVTVPVPPASPPYNLSFVPQ